MTATLPSRPGPTVTGSTPSRPGPGLGSTVTGSTPSRPGPGPGSTVTSRSVVVAASSDDPPVRLGDIAFVNCHPVRWGLAQGGTAATRRPNRIMQEDPVGPGYRLVSAAPSRLGRGLLAGALDVSPISLADYLTHSDELVLLPELALGSLGTVRSCLLLSRRPLSELDGRRVALSSASRTTTLLARTLLEQHVGVQPTYVSWPQPGTTMPSGADAVVVIGDDALRLWAQPPDGWIVHDTGDLWRRWTGLPMVYAVWAARRDFARRHPSRLAEVGAALDAAVWRSAADPARMVRAAARRHPGFAEPLLDTYLRGLSFEFGAAQRAAVRAFAALAPIRPLVSREPARPADHTARPVAAGAASPPVVAGVAGRPVLEGAVR